MPEGLRAKRRQESMSDPEDIVERLTRHLDQVAALREIAVNEPRLEAARQRLRAWQAVRLARTHADLLANPRMGLAASSSLPTSMAPKTSASSTQTSGGSCRR